MARRLISSVLILALLPGCSGWSDSRVNPSNWFGGGADTPDTLVPAGATAVEDSRPLVAQITALSVEPTPGGIILTATGLPPTQGYSQGALLLDNQDGVPVDGTLTFQFRAAPPIGTAAVGPAASREVIVGVFLSRQNLQGVSTLRVVGAGNERSIRP
jgi:hypothetical protein